MRMSIVSLSLETPSVSVSDEGESDSGPFANILIGTKRVIAGFITH